MDEKVLKKIRRRKIINKFLLVLIFILTIVFCYSSYKIILWQIDNNNGNKAQKNAIKDSDIVEVSSKNARKAKKPKNKFDPYFDYINYPLINVDFMNLLKTNSDTVAWIQIKGTKINYPVVQTDNNNFYLNHDYYRKYNDAGWVFMDYRNNSDLSDNKNTIIYAHSRVDGSMFHTLRNTLEKKWFDNKDNRIIKISTPEYNASYLIFSSYKTNAESYYLTTDFNSDEEFEYWLKKIKKRSKFNFNTEVYKEDSILTLSSCYTANGIRMAVHARLINLEEKN